MLQSALARRIRAPRRWSRCWAGAGANSPLPRLECCIRFPAVVGRPRGKITHPSAGATSLICIWSATLETGLRCPTEPPTGNRSGAAVLEFLEWAHRGRRSLSHATTLKSYAVHSCVEAVMRRPVSRHVPLWAPDGQAVSRGKSLRERALGTKFQITQSDNSCCGNLTNVRGHR